MTNPRELVDADETTWALRNVLRGYAAANVSLARRLDLSPNDLEAMEYLLDDGELGPVELGHRLGIRSASATAMVDRLEAAGHLRRRSHPTDRRRRTLEVTTEANHSLMQTLGPLIGELSEAAAALTPKERARVNQYLVAVAEVLWSYAEDRDIQRKGQTGPFEG